MEGAAWASAVRSAQAKKECLFGVSFVLRRLELEGMGECSSVVCGCEHCEVGKTLHAPRVRDLSCLVTGHWSLVTGGGAVYDVRVHNLVSRVFGF
ncbi:hypothetical protein KC19_1G000800 [Ceratodon purpureus]|uniref:Uncharacterized protein n=1 Tax=Ceratodon purpureus TaxID=3225 RepID=A0A8T0J2S8_CERPU|nr:hypothetical protein KC19_1G000800 [Ceratodon purpureus]